MSNADSPVAIVTGGGGAFGSAISRRLSADGWRVALADIDLERTAETAAGISAAMAVHMDVLDVDSIRRAVAEVGERWGRVDAVVNNAGMLARGTVATMEVAALDRTIGVNLRGPFLVTQAAMPYLLKSPAARVIMIGSRNWLSGGNPAYSATKAGVIGLARSLAVELGPTRGTSNVVAPGPVSTPLTGVSDEKLAGYAERTLLGRTATPADVADAVAFFAGEDARFVTGEVLHVAGGLQMAPPLG